MGGKRKKSSNGPLKKESKYKIPSRFDCPLCDTKASIIVKVFRATSDATVRCRVCGAGGTKRWSVLRLEAPVDVFFRFHEALIQRDHADLQHVEEMRRVARRNSGASNSQLDHPISVDEATTHAAADQPSRGSFAAASASLPQPSKQVRSLGELQRKLTLPAAAGSGVAMAAMTNTRAIELVDDYAAEAEGAAEHLFAPRRDVHSGEDSGDEYDRMFQ
ncbi:transcription elongation factor 1-like protein [Novymonas esmeraldas]|uniref:Transcription elongation factor 1 homolog n=1 Tax=Novymonas esmeraldas TaxID=1808958 RepID=A0AAW0EN07_9TRYP